MIRIWAFPSTGSYTSPLYQAFPKEEVTVSEGVWSFSWLKQHVSAGDIVHLHWPSFAYVHPTSKLKSALSFIKFLLNLFLVRVKGGDVCWTAHNLLPHDRCLLPLLDIIGRHVLISQCKLIFVHGPHARQQLENRFPRTKNKNVEIPHGHWIDYYGPQTEKNSARTVLSLPPNKTILIIFGQLRAYKNIHLIIEFLQNTKNPDLFLLVAGKFKSEKYQHQIEKLLQSNTENIRLDAKFIPNEDVPLYLAASDFMIMPYREILTSGTAMLAISYGCPIISIKAGFLIDVITPETGLFIDEITQNEIENVVTEAQNNVWDKEQILAHAKTFSFDEAAQITIKNIIKKTALF
jgi:beta-1,4-mannosyltransferase